MAKQSMRHFGGNKKIASVGNSGSTAPRGGGLPMAAGAKKNAAKRTGRGAPKKASGVPARRQVEN